MAPIPVHIKSPINAAKAEGITPKTAAADENGPSGIAQPGASPNNAPAAPTSPIQNQLHAPLQPTPTQKITPGETVNNTNTPPPPQPGAVPYPPASKTAMPPPPGAPSNPNYASPPPPATTQAAVLPGTGTGGVTYPTLTPPQMGMSLAEPAAPHTYRGTSSTTTAAPGSRQVGHTTADSNGGYPGYPPPGGYQQNPNASGGQYSHSYEQSRGNNSMSVGAGGGNYQDDGDEGGVWNSAMKWAQTAGEKLSAAESEVWKRINKE